ncbi:hypothetical protein R4Z10_18885 [Niallia sp. XMNu-256]|uniref:hypothetical protein n=1 Tax=Niallia sp. XMNu-256 TaxID=3082444 RepID=UPI0030D39313
MEKACGNRNSTKEAGIMDLLRNYKGKIGINPIEYTLEIFINNKIVFIVLNIEMAIGRKGETRGLLLFLLIMTRNKGRFSLFIYQCL